MKEKIKVIEKVFMLNPGYMSESSCYLAKCLGISNMIRMYAGEIGFLGLDRQVVFVVELQMK